MASVKSGGHHPREPGVSVSKLRMLFDPSKSGSTPSTAQSVTTQNSSNGTSKPPIAPRTEFSKSVGKRAPGGDYKDTINLDPNTSIKIIEKPSIKHQGVFSNRRAFFEKADSPPPVRKFVTGSIPPSSPQMVHKRIIPSLPDKQVKPEPVKRQKLDSSNNKERIEHKHDSGISLDEKVNLKMSDPESKHHGVRLSSSDSDGDPFDERRNRIQNSSNIIKSNDRDVEPVKKAPEVTRRFRKNSRSPDDGTKRRSVTDPPPFMKGTHDIHHVAAPTVKKRGLSASELISLDSQNQRKSGSSERSSSVMSDDSELYESSVRQHEFISPVDDEFKVTVKTNEKVQSDIPRHIDHQDNQNNTVYSKDISSSVENVHSCKTTMDNEQQQNEKDDEVLMDTSTDDLKTPPSFIEDNTPEKLDDLTKTADFINEGEREDVETEEEDPSEKGVNESGMIQIGITVEETGDSDEEEESDGNRSDVSEIGSSDYEYTVNVEDEMDEDEMENKQNNRLEEEEEQEEVKELEEHLPEPYEVGGLSPENTDIIDSGEIKRKRTLIFSTRPIMSPSSVA
ncbi:glutamic acid-rich protein-like [Anneissia japonica]|uniref:glutamic acid-rich protein-like n=1 Tax=Anneissia japonica TaxID=1529436 RepID=UPI00142553D2|nr:glutamic acid-rich protein-like [Anneissia japonica]XP_033101487.1 glutamic acid-rich protein-like [Anneissia japonica]